MMFWDWLTRWDWLAREGWIFLSWWGLVTAAGLAALPLCWRLLGGLPDRGYTLARPVGLLLTGLVYWLLASLGFIGNSTGGMVLAWGVVLCVALALFLNMQDDSFNWRTYWRENRWVILSVEAMFLVLFFSWTVYRAYQNDTFSTEKPMEIMFISSIMRSDSFPPNDAWMAGYAISYYYFGYVMAAMLSMLSGVNSGVGFSMMLALLFGLTGQAAFGVGYNLARSRSQVAARLQSHSSALLTGALAAVFVVLLGNFHLPFIELPYQSRSMPEEYFAFWDVQERGEVGLDFQQNSPLTLTSPMTHPGAWQGWWWFRASRVIQDYNLDGTAEAFQPIDEFPAFSFVLGDVHPHVLSLPFVLMTIGLAFNLIRLRRVPNAPEMIFYGVAIGGLVFLNTWDGPIYWVVLVGAEGLRRLMGNETYRLSWADFFKTVGFGLVVALVAIIVYLPFLIGFRSQAGGLIPNLLHPTLFRQYFIMFGPLLLLTGGFLMVEVWRGSKQRTLNWRLGLTVVGGIWGTILLLVLVLMIGFLLSPAVQHQVETIVAQQGGWGNVLPQLLTKRLTHALTALVLLGTLVVVVARVFPRAHKLKDDAPVGYPVATGFALLLVAAAAGLTLLPEYVYLRDVFGARINTVFKFYYQAWILLSIASAYGVYTVLSEMQLPRPNGPVRVGYTVVLGFVLLTGLMYPVFGVYGRAIVEQGRHAQPVANWSAVTLDGRADNLPTGYFEALVCLADVVGDTDEIVVAEASRDTYNSAYGRAGAFLGLPTVINWEGHERQWRGSTYPAVAGTRRADVDRLYTDLRWEIAEEIIARYGIDYVVYGPTEIAQHNAVGEEKFREHARLVCETSSTRIYGTG